MVDYLGLADQLKKALVTYTESGGQGQGMSNEEFRMTNGLNFGLCTSALGLFPIPAGQEHILELADGKKRWVERMTNAEFRMSN